MVVGTNLTPPCFCSQTYWYQPLFSRQLIDTTEWSIIHFLQIWTISRVLMGHLEIQDHHAGQG